eukprot:CCRYP_011418-RA/>CCRYP_011418-RA protein AED:0.39 eAED:0.39 QI:0/-1/0/1/-1/1/1/0/179
MNHYQTLGLPQSATPEEIKKAYRKLSLETHPDVTKGCQNTNAEKFKRISAAYSVLGNEKAKRSYDRELKEHFSGFRRGNSSARGAGTGGSTPSFGSALPRNVLIGSLLGFAGVTFMRAFMPQEEEMADRWKSTGQKRLVEAWMNPKTNRFEKPRPWDEEYRRLKPVLQLVPREDVYDRK